MATAGNITAVLTLNSSGFQTGLSNSLKAVESFKKSVGTVGKDVTSMESALKMLDTVLEVAIRQIAEFNGNVGNLSNFNKYAQSVNRIANALRILSSSEVNAVESMNLINNMFKYFQGSLDGTEIKIKGVTSSLNELSVKENQVSVSSEKLANSERQVSNSSNQASASIQKQASASDKATASTNRQATATRGLGKALSSLRMMGSMVGSMLAYNFIHKLGQATNETINAKSEMEGYFQMLHFSKSQIDGFNKSLDETIKKFPRLNKYSLGETISSIGVEFELTTKEMKKAMPVVSMITSEYLRAGRNANEASLAVKDILQGEFQRLSRETGVKGDQLKEAGWSGDKSDVMGLLDALQKVGESRNWDTFVVKANSLNDAVLILQNRFSEWSADMVNVVQPTILAVFNNLMSFGQGMAEGLSGIWKWLNTDGFTQTAVKVGALATSVYSLTTAFAMYRTGASLVELRNTSLLKTIYSMITGTKLEAMANMSVRDSITAKLLGLKAEEVAEKGLVGAINSNMVAKRLSTASTEEETVARGFNTASIQAQMMGLNAETDAEELNNLAKQLNIATTGEQTGATIGFTGALYGMITGEGLAEGATLSLTGAIGALTGAFLSSPVGWFALAILGLASAFYVLTGGLDDSWAKMKQFKETMKDTSSAKESADKWLDSLKKKVGETSEEFKKGKQAVKEYKDEIDYAKGVYDQAESMFEGGNLTRKTTTEGILSKYGIDKKQIKGINDDLDAISFGYGKYYEAMQVYNKQFANEDSNFAKQLDSSMSTMEKYGAKKGEMKDMAKDLSKNYQNLAEHSYIANTSDDWWEGSWNKLYAGLDQLWIDLDEAKIRFGKWWNEDVPKSLGDTSKWLTDAWDGLDQWITDGIGNLGKRIDDWFKDIGKSFGDSWKYLEDAWNNNIVKPLTDLWNGFWSFDWLIGGDSSGGSGIAKHIDGSGFLQSLLPSITLEDVTAFANEHIILPITEWWNGFIANPLGFLGLPQIDFGALIGSFFGGLEGIASFIATYLTPIKDAISNTFNISNLVSIFTTGLQTIFTTASTISASVSGVFSNLKSMIWGHIQGILTNVTTTFTNIKTSATNQINGLKDGVTGAINKVTDAFKHMRDSILDSAKRIMDGVKEKFDKVKDTIGGFYHKLTNPSEWFSGSGTRSYSSQPKPRTARRLFAPVTRTVTGKHGAGVNPYTKPQQQVSLKELVNMLGGDKTVNLGNFLSLFDGSGFGGWDFAKAHKDTIFKEGKSWNAKSPSLNGVTLGDGFPVRRFWSGEAKGFTWSEFMSVATAIFSAIPYKFYMDSDWKGNWVSALLSGAMNCSDGADALIALANLFGFSGSKQHMNLKDGTGHFFAIINGKKMDTTHFQNSGSWSPLSGAGVPTRSYVRRNGQTQDNKTVNVTVDMSNSVIYGVDDLDKRIEDGVDKGMQKHLNDPFTVAI